MQYGPEQWLNMNRMGGKRGDKVSGIRSCEALGYIHTLSYYFIYIQAWASL